MLQWQSWILAMETIWPAKPQIFTIWLFIKFADICCMYRHGGYCFPPGDLSLEGLCPQGTALATCRDAWSKPCLIGWLRTRKWWWNKIPLKSHFCYLQRFGPWSDLKHLINLLEYAFGVKTGDQLVYSIEQLILYWPSPFQPPLPPCHLNCLRGFRLFSSSREQVLVILLAR